MEATNGTTAKRIPTLSFQSARRRRQHVQCRSALDDSRVPVKSLPSHQKVESGGFDGAVVDVRRKR
jgi:hypothetical protein